MASLFHPPIKPLLYHHHSTSSSSSLPSITPSPKSSSNTNSYLPRARNLFCSAEFRKRKSCIKRGCICRSALDEASVKYSSEAEQSKAELVSSSKLKLLSAVSGLNRGLAATEDDRQKADAAAKDLESVAGPVDLLVDIDKLQGRWKLIYSSAFSSRTLGGSRPGPPTGRLLPITLGQVFQRIDVLSKDFDNIVDLELGAPWPLPPVELTATLAHKFEIIGTSNIKITFEKTTVKTAGNLSQLPSLEVPRIPDFLRPPSNRGTGEFEVTYLDSDTRITRGDREELRVFVIS
ncbi:plastid-lipid-associated protein 6, chloroplastic [Coffea eugenioides]|uniref:Plastid-lipid-associated protein 6, chloroplastic-like n=1 Tax=Coffea arabica TaxID=13443 RepID=A0A6P6WTZ3_COFAR|nr:plastid-lipid-associated protein 6, chloroplastic-like [Coffea arabica]XP_027118844.1 plastid-lipid-associated protein 6, chloroplastic-like [Coffea arabica]XP_027164920.1 plastid-lipid-associated protein 6, chloroplastic [Coffea eugenioides]